MSAMLGLNGAPLVECSTARAWRSWSKSGITCVLEWIAVAGRESEGGIAAMSFFPSHQRMNTGKACILADNAHVYFRSAKDGKPGYATSHLLRFAVAATLTMGYGPDKSIATRIVDMALDAAQDLIRMPTAPPGGGFKEAKPLGIEVVVKDGDRVIHEALQ